jgi:hypothetical protein
MSVGEFNPRTYYVFKNVSFFQEGLIEKYKIRRNTIKFRDYGV